jgi:Ca2+/Na+ antiporter
MSSQCELLIIKYVLKRNLIFGIVAVILVLLFRAIIISYVNSSKLWLGILIVIYMCATALYNFLYVKKKLDQIVNADKLINKLIE